MEFEPQSAEGAALADAAASPAVQRRTGMSGALMGLDFAAVRARLPAGFDPDIIRPLFAALEAGTLEGEARRREREQPMDSQKGSA